MVNAFTILLVSSLKILPNANSIILLENSNSNFSSTLQACSSKGVKYQPPRNTRRTKEGEEEGEREEARKEDEEKLEREERRKGKESEGRREGRNNGRENKQKEQKGGLRRRREKEKKGEKRTIRRS